LLFAGLFGKILSLAETNRIGAYGQKRAMKKFYYEIWLPFTVTKRRILILALASYIALC
jgi:hypothetical protein